LAFVTRVSVLVLKVLGLSLWSWNLFLAVK